MKLVDNYLESLVNKDELKVKHFLHIFQQVEKAVGPLLYDEIDPQYRVSLPVEER